MGHSRVVGIGVCAAGVIYALASGGDPRVDLPAAQTTTAADVRLLPEPPRVKLWNTDPSRLHREARDTALASRRTDGTMTAGAASPTRVGSPPAPPDPAAGRPAIASLLEPFTPPIPFSTSAIEPVHCLLEADTGFNASVILQDCIDRTPAGQVLELPARRYVLYRQLVVSKPITIRTAGSGDPSFSCVATPDACAVLVAGAGLFDMWGLLLVHSTADVALEHIAFDGNRAARMESAAAQSCRAGENRYGFNVSVVTCERCRLTDIISRNALCGTGMLWSGGQAVIERSDFSMNGDATAPLMWADGLTLVYAPDSRVRGNRFVDNTDVALIVGYGVRSSVERNQILQRRRQAFAGLMLHNFDSSDLRMRGDFRGGEVKYNTVDCGRQLCLYGIQVGPRPWDPTANIIGGEIHHNEVMGAKIGINADGAGVPAAPVAIYQNVVVNVPAGAAFSDCGHGMAAAWMNISPTSVVDRRGEFDIASAQLSDQCQFRSRLAPVPATPSSVTPAAPGIVRPAPADE